MSKWKKSCPQFVEEYGKCSWDYHDCADDCYCDFSATLRMRRLIDHKQWDRLCFDDAITLNEDGIMTDREYYNYLSWMHDELIAEMYELVLEKKLDK